MSGREVQINAASLEEGVARAVRALARASRVSLRFQDDHTVWTEEAGVEVAEAIMGNKQLDKFELTFPEPMNLLPAQTVVAVLSAHPSISVLKLVNLRAWRRVRLVHHHPFWQQSLDGTLRRGSEDGGRGSHAAFAGPSRQHDTTKSGLVCK